MQDIPYKAPAQAIFRFMAKPKISQIIVIPPAKTQDDPYEKLPCTDNQRTCIYEIITTLAENGKVSLLFKQNHLKEIGIQINDVHPLKFLSSIFSDPHLKECMINIFDDYFKRNGFMDGLAPSMTNEAEKGKLNQYLEEFAKDVQVPVEDIRPFFDAKDWEGLVRYLIGE